MAELWLPPEYRKKQQEPAGIGQVLVYFENAAGRISIPAVTHQQAPLGWQRHEIPLKNVREIERVSKRMEAQRQKDFDNVDGPFALRLAARMQKVREKLNTILLTTKSDFERDFLRKALKQLEEKERRLRQRRVEGYLHMEAESEPIKQ